MNIYTPEIDRKPSREEAEAALAVLRQWANKSSDDEIAQIFVSPAVSETLNVLATLTHELVHAVDDCASGHKAGFIKIASQIGFEPKYTSSENRSDTLTETLQEIAEQLGDFPHAAIRRPKVLHAQGRQHQ